MKLFSRGWIAAGALALSCWALQATAQTADQGAIRGQIQDSSGAIIAGVTVSASSPDAPGIHTAVTASDGQFRLLNLPPGVYTVSAERDGFQKSVQSGLVIRAGLNLTTNFVMQVGAVQQTVSVNAQSSILETEQPDLAAYVSSRFVQDLPLTTRHDLSDALEVAPGVAERNFVNNNGVQVYMLRGTDVEQHVVLVDGADMGSSRQGRTDFVNFSPLSVADTQVKTGGGDASQPAGLGVVVSYEGKSGTNQFHGAVESSYQTKAWNANNNPLGVPTLSDGYDPEGAIGGPILKSHLWFYTSYRYLHRNTQISRDPADLQHLTSIQPGWVPFDNRSRTQASFTKIDAQLTAKHRLSGFYLWEGGTDEGNQSTNIKPLVAGAVAGSGYSLRLISTWSNSLITDIGASFNNISGNPTFAAFNGLDYGGPQVLLYNAINSSAGKLVGNGLLATTGNNKNFTIGPADKVTIGGSISWVKTGWGGSHEFQGGVFIQPRMHLTSETRYLNGGYILQEEVLKTPGDFTSGYVPFHRQYVDSTKLDYLSADSSSQDYAGYVQDNWKPVPRLTIIPGFRIDYVHAYDNLFQKQTQASFEPQPRLGVTFALTKDDKNIIHASLSRLSAKPEPAFLPSLGGSVTTTTTDVYDTKRDGSWATTLVTPAQSKTAANSSIDPNRHMERVDEYLVGFRRQFPADISFDGTWVRRYYRGMPAKVDVNGIYQNNQFLGYNDPTQNAILEQTNNVWNTPVYTGIEFTAQQRTRRAQFMVGYTRTFQHLEGTYQPTDPALYISPATFADDAGIGSIRGNESNSLSGTAQTRNPMWVKHVVHIAGSYSLRWGFLVSSNFNMMAGAYTGPIVKYLSAPDPAFGPSTITLSNGRVVSNPLATTVRFAYANRGAGQLQSPTLDFWDGRVAKTFNLAESRSLVFGVNITNILDKGADQEFLGGSTTTASTGSNQIGSINFAYAPDGTFRGQNRQAPRAAQLTLRFDF
jgi:Carboxypeptidase regulatory-like domain/TonB-dependent Receptor Plug Domain